MRGFIVGVVFYTIGQILTWFQTNGQFIWPVFRKNQWAVSIVGGTVISYLFITATRYLAEYNDGLVWPGRFIGFAVGIITFAILTNYFLNEGISLKTAVSLLLAICLICIQLFWK